MMKRQISRAFLLIGRSLRLWWDDWSNYILVSLVVVLVSLTVVLVGPAILGVAYSVREHLEGQRSGITGWRQGFKRYFGVGIIWSLVNIFVILGIVFNIWFYSETRVVWAPVLVVLFLLFLLFWLLLQLFTPGILLEQKTKSLWRAWKTVIRVWMSAPVQAVTAGFFMLIIGLLSIGLFLPLLLGTVPLLCLLSVQAVETHTHPDVAY